MIMPLRRPDIIQYAWVVPNLEAAARHWHATMGVGPFLINRNLAISDARHRGVSRTPRFSTAVAQSGAVQIELVEQLDDAPSAYRDTIAAGTTGLHHVAIVAADFDITLESITVKGHAIAADGRFGDTRFAYVDTHAAIGCMTEIVEDSGAIRAFFGAVRKAAERWDGDTATLLRELPGNPPPS